MILSISRRTASADTDRRRRLAYHIDRFSGL